jgi:hypothetical protein
MEKDDEVKISKAAAMQLRRALIQALCALEDSMEMKRTIPPKEERRDANRNGRTNHL